MLTKKIDSSFCKYEPKESKYKDIFKDPYSSGRFDIELDVPTDITLIVDLAGDAERLLKKYKFESIDDLDKYLERIINE